MHSCVTSKNAKWCHLIWPTRYIDMCYLNSLLTKHLTTNIYIGVMVCAMIIITRKTS